MSLSVTRATSNGSSGRSVSLPASSAARSRTTPRSRPNTRAARTAGSGRARNRSTSGRRFSSIGGSARRLPGQPRGDLDLDLLGRVGGQAVLHVLSRGDAGVGLVCRVVADVADRDPGVGDLAAGDLDQLVADLEVELVALRRGVGLHAVRLPRRGDLHLQPVGRRIALVVAEVVVEALADQEAFA